MHAAHAGERDPAGPLSPTMRVNTNTRTQFQDAFYESHVSIADRVSSPKFKSSVMKQTGHLGMDCMSATDPRQHTVVGVVGGWSLEQYQE